MTDEELLTKMRAIYQYATLESHMLVDGDVYLRCRRCKTRPVPHHYVAVMNCDQCLEERLAEDA